ncbi:aldehyde dehydrogenase family protein, partial [Vibrio parahaemolyticus SBR10290]
STSTGCG